MAYALISLVNILEQDQQHLLLDCKPQIQSFLKEARRLKKELVEKSNTEILPIYLEDQIRKAAEKAEDIIECHVRDQLLSSDRNSKFDLLGVMSDFEYIELQMTKQFQKSSEIQSLSFEAIPSLKKNIYKMEHMKSVKEHSSEFKKLSVKYKQLPSHLKPCLLYIGSFPRFVNINSSRLIKLWIAEGFVEPSEKNLEETANLYLEDLIGRDLLRVSQNDIDGKVKALSFEHDVNRFCKLKAFEENFMWYKHSYGYGILEDTDRRVSVGQLSQFHNKTTLMSLARSFQCIGHASLRLFPAFQKMTLLRVLDVFQLEFFQFPKEMLQLVLLRYLAFSCNSDLPWAISKFLNLQTLIMRRLPSSRGFTLPPGLWDLTQLRHIISKETCVWYIPRNGKDVIQENLQTLSNINVFLLTNKFVGRIPNVTKLGIFCDSSLTTDVGLDCLQKVETLKCSASWSSVTRDFLSYLKLPGSIKKLTLSFCKIPWGFMTTVGSLPNLEHLKLQNSDFLGMTLDPIESEYEAMEPEWVLVEQAFLRLRSLHMKELDLVHWRVHDNSFPILQHLVIRDCCMMTEIPPVIGHITTLKLIEVDESSSSALASAKQIKAENRLQRGLLELRICKT